MNIQNLVTSVKLKNYRINWSTLVTGDFKGAFNAGKNFGSDVSKNWEDVAKNTPPV